MMVDLDGGSGSNNGLWTMMPSDCRGGSLSLWQLIVDYHFNCKSYLATCDLCNQMIITFVLYKCQDAFHVHLCCA